MRLAKSLRHARRTGFILILGAALMLWPGFAPAQSYSEDELRTFARATVALDQVFAEWQPRIEQAASDEEALELQQQANEAMVAAVIAAGLDVSDYNRLHELFQSDPAVSAKVMDYRQEFAE